MKVYRAAQMSQLDREFAHFSLTAGLRADYVSDFDLFPAGSLGGSWAIAPATLLKLNSGYSVKIPSFGQLYQPSHGSMDHVRGNPDLGEEGVWLTDSDFAFHYGYPDDGLRG
ncbi:MAG: TonB-dependent receptor [Candidatus Electrothrix sp. ATG2]|nr:TonB-dependent receptor [Candidatus Electrothrix sp. ATG2]